MALILPSYIILPSPSMHHTHRRKADGLGIGRDNLIPISLSDFQKLSLFLHSRVSCTQSFVVMNSSSLGTPLRLMALPTASSF